MRILFLPIDNRPVCYQLPEMIAEINSDIDLILPPVELLGDLTKSADVSALFGWLKKNISDIDYTVLSLDTIAYGGLIPSRRSEESFNDVKERILELKKIIQTSGSKVYAFSSIMRISNNNINQEEKLYWNKYGTMIFEYSYNYHKYGIMKSDVPDEILEDYLKTRKRNFEINKEYLRWQKEGIIDTLVFTKDDCAEYGLNVIEAAELEKLGGYTKTGADEIPLSLLARCVEDKIKVFPVFAEPDCKHLVSNYEDVSIEKSVSGQLELANCQITNAKCADVVLFINNFRNMQGEIVMEKNTELFSGTWTPPEKPYAIADVRLANGADNNFMQEFLKSGLDDNFIGYSGWNTSANTLGSLICQVKIYLDAKRKNAINQQCLKKLQAIRFLDDWAYQANVRQQLSSVDIGQISEGMKLYEYKVNSLLNTNFKPTYSFPWQRLFEVKIELN